MSKLCTEEGLDVRTAPMEPCAIEALNNIIQYAHGDRPGSYVRLIWSMHFFGDTVLPEYSYHKLSSHHPFIMVM